MKFLSKLNVNPQKIMKNDELLNIRGGYGSSDCGIGCGSDYECKNDCKSCKATSGMPEVQTCQS